MKTLFKLILGLGGLIALLLVIVIVIVPAVVDPNDYKGTIAEQVKAQTGRDLHLNGDIALSLFPWIGLNLKDAAISNAAGFEPADMARIGDAQVKVKLMPLITSFGKRIEMDTVLVEGLEVHLAKNADGVSNWDDLVKSSEEAQTTPSQGESGDSPLDALAVGGVEVRNALITWNDAATGQDVRIQALNLNTGPVALGAPIDVKLEFDIQGQEPPIEGHVTGATPIELDLERQVFKATNLTLEAGLLGDALPGGKANIGVGGAMEFDGANQTFTVGGLDIRLSELALAGGNGEINLSGNIKGDLASQRFDLNGLNITSAIEGGSFPDGLDVELDGDIFAALGEQSITSSELKLRIPALRLPGLAGNMSATTVLDGKLDANVFSLNDFTATAQLSGERLSGGSVNLQLNSELVANLDPGVFEANGIHLAGKVTGEAVPGGEQPIDLRANVVMSQSEDSLIVSDLALEAGELRATGALNATSLSTTPALNGDISVPTFNLRSVMGTFGQDLPPMNDAQALSAVGLNATIASEGSGANVNPLTITLDDTTMTGDIAVAQFDPLAIRFNLDADQLDLDRYMAPPGAEQPVAAPSASTATTSGDTAELPLEQLRALDIDGSLRVGTLKASNVKLANIALGVNAKDGIIAMNPLSADLYGGNFAGNVMLDATGDMASLFIDENINGLQLSALLNDLGVDVGALDLSGASSIALKATASGDPAAKTYNVKGLSLTADLQGPGLPGGALAFRAGGDVAADLNAQTLKASDFMLGIADLVATANLDVTELDGNANFNGTLDVPAFNAKSLLQAFSGPEFQTSDPTALSSVSVATTLSGSKNSISLEPLKVTLDESTLEGRFAVDDFATQALRFELALDQINADRYLPPAGQGDVQTEAATPAGEEAPVIPVDTIRGLNLDGTMRVGTLVMSNLTLNNILVTTKGSGGRLALSPLQADLYEGNYSGNINIDASGDQPSVSLDESFQNIEVGPMLLALRGDDTLTGTTNIKTKLTASGAYANDLKRTLNGNIDFNFLNGSVKGIDVVNLICGGLASLGAMPSGATGTEARTQFAELTGTSQITNGVVQNPDLNMKSPLIRVEGQGNADLVQESVDYMLSAGLVASCEGQGGSGLADLSGVKVPVHITGPFTNLSYAPDFGTLLETAAPAQVKEKIEQVEQKIDEELQKAEEKVTEKIQEKVGDAVGEQVGEELGNAVGEEGKKLLKGLFGN